MPTIFTIAAVQILGFLVVYFLLKRWLARSIRADESGQKIQDELGSIMVELNRTTEQNIQLIEDKIGTLQELLAEVDKRLSVLKRESEKHEISRSIYDQIKRGQGSDRKEQIGDRNIQKKVMRLHREGISPSVIAGHLGTTVGEVELIISLENSKD